MESLPMPELERGRKLPFSKEGQYRHWPLTTEFLQNCC